MGGVKWILHKKKWFFFEKSKKKWKKLKKMHQKWVAGCLCGQNMKNYEWNSCKKLWTWEGVNKFYITKLIFSKQSWKKNWKKLKKIEKKCIKSELLGASDMTWTCPGHVQDMSRSCSGHGRTCPGHSRTHEDSYGFLKIQNRTKTQ